MPALSSPHLPVRPSVAQVMRAVMYALLPGAGAYVALFGVGVLINIVLCTAAALVTEALMLRLRRWPLAPFLSDWSAVITGVLLALALPPLAPWWLPVAGGAFALVLGKHLFGGLGSNPFNPAMVGYVVLLVALPLEMTRWLGASPLWAPAMPLGEQLALVFGSWPASADAITAATPLDHLRTELTRGLTLGEALPGGAGALFAHGHGWVALGYLAGGLWLLARGIIRWQIPAGVLGALGFMALVFWGADADRYASPAFHWLAGAAMLGAFFIATDPVTACTTPLGRLLYGIGIGVLTWIIRSFGGYPDAIAFAVLLLNLCVPLIDQYTKPRVYGQKRTREAP